MGYIQYLRVSKPTEIRFSRFLYAMLVCMDANFRLKNHLVSNSSTDPGFSNGMAYMTPRSPYEAYVLSQADAEDVRINTTPRLGVANPCLRSVHV